MSPTPEDREREPFRWCVYCDADCEADEPEHAADCPDSTGIYPVKVHKHCESCTCDGTIFCGDCNAELRVGDFYMLREIAGADPALPGLEVMEGAAWFMVICIGCAAAHELT